MPVAGRMHQLRRHMALLGHPVLGDPRYTYGYANRHPDAPIRLTPAQSQQAMTKPFGVASDHPYYTPDPAAKLTYVFWASQRLGLATKSVSGAVPGASSEPSSYEASNVDAQAASAEGARAAASEVGQVAATFAVSSMQAHAVDAVEVELVQDSLRLHRPNRMAKPQQSSQTSVQASGRDPTMTDLSLQAQSRLEASAPHYSGALAQQQQAVSMQTNDQPLPAALQRMLCLWAVRLMMPHPLTHAKMHFSIPDPPLFHQMRDAEAQLAWKLRQESSQ